MSFNIEVQGGSSVRLPTAGKYCDRDIVVTATGGSDDLAKQIITRSIEKIADNSIETIGEYAFCNCTSLTEASFQNCTAVGVYAFDKSGLVTADFPKLKKVTQNSFASCTSLKNIGLPEAVQLTSNSFPWCITLEKIDLPKVTILNTAVFKEDSMLSTLILRSNTCCTLTGINSFDGTPIASGTGYIYVPSALVDRYKTATNWSAFANQFRAIEDYPDICGG